MITTPTRRSASAKTVPTGKDADCPNCGDELLIHQPDPETPDRLLGTCDECKSWYLLNRDWKVLGVIQV